MAINHKGSLGFSLIVKQTAKDRLYTATATGKRTHTQLVCTAFLRAALLQSHTNIHNCQRVVIVLIDFIYFIFIHRLNRNTPLPISRGV